MSDGAGDPPEYVLETMGIEREVWNEMTHEERIETCEEFVVAVTEAMQPFVNFVRDELMPTLTEAMEPACNTMVDIANQIESAEINHDELSLQESAQINQFVQAAKRYEQSKQRSRKR